MPVAELDRLAVFRKAGYIPHAGQRAIHQSTARHRVAACGRRFGKSTIGGGDLYSEAVATRYLLGQLAEADQRREFWIVGPEYTDSEKEFRFAYNALKRRGAPFDRPGTYYSAHDSDMQISMYGGRLLIIGKSAKHPERLVGEGLSGVVMAEAAKMRESVWTRFIRPTLADFKGWSLWNSTPEGKNWFYDYWMKGQSAHEYEWQSWRRPAWLNPHVYPKGATRQGLQMLMQARRFRQPLTMELREASGVDPEIISLLMDLTPESFNQEIGADFSEYAGRVLKEFDEEIHVRDLERDNTRRTFAACDYGFTNPFVWLLIQEDVWGNVYVLDELYERGMDVEEASEQIKARNLHVGVQRFYPDPADPANTRYLAKHLKIQPAGGTGGELATRIRLIRNWLKETNIHLGPDDPGRQPRLFIDRTRCPNTIREFNDWRYPKTEAEAAEYRTNLPENPLKKDDHTPEALGRYFVARHGSAVGGGARVATADMG